MPTGEVTCLACERLRRQFGIEGACCERHGIFSCSHEFPNGGTFSNIIDQKPITFADVRRAWIRVNNMIKAPDANH